MKVLEKFRLIFQFAIEISALTLVENYSECELGLILVSRIG